ncbi:AAA family ATPase [Pseudactinotalea sp. Z1748]|uniref:AAA family ATPase n=1 Tax=Pseudactinotalea sp. Z1748 TaxID=3413027 RepID=UPI003C7BE8EE
MINLEDLGLKPAVTPEPTQVLPPSQQPDPNAPGELAPGSVEAQALWQAWRGNPVTVVNSPPGAGKSSLVAAVAHRLQHETDLKVVLATPTVAAGEALAVRIAQRAGIGAVEVSGRSFTKDLRDVITPGWSTVERELAKRNNSLIVRTVASCKMSPPVADLLIIDEAYQVTFADATSAAEGAEQVLLVGDPGQIGPPTTVDTAPWDRLSIAPHHRAPEGFLRRADAVELRLPHSYRLGPETVKAITPLYDFTFDSARPDVALSGARELEALIVDPSEGVSDRKAMEATAQRVEDLIGRTVTSDGGQFTVAPEDVAVVAARNEQTSALSALLRARGLAKVTVGTADRLQGGQWAVVVAVDPFFGSPVGSSHSRSLGRLCVMASRHITHLTWVTSNDWRQVITATAMDEQEAAGHLSVRKALTKNRIKP